MASERPTRYEKIKIAVYWRGACDSFNWHAKNPYKRRDLALVWEEGFNESIDARLRYLEYGDDNKGLPS